MFDGQILEQKPVQIYCRINASLLAVLKILNQSQVLSLTISPQGKMYEPPVKDKTYYSTILANLKSLADATNNNVLMPLAELQNFEFTLSREAISDFTAQLLSSDLSELTGLGEKFQNALGVNVDMAKPATSQLAGLALLSSKKLSILEIDQTAENKILFLYLYRKSNENWEKIAERLQLLTMEQKEKIWEEISDAKPSLTLPTSLCEQTLCSMEAVDELINLKPLIFCPDIKIVCQPFTTELGLTTPEFITNSSKQELYYSTMEMVKKHFSENRLAYVIPRLFRQRAIIFLNLKSIEYLKELKSALANEILLEAGKYLPFLKNFINKR